MILPLIQTLSKERFTTYLIGAGHDQDRALALYIWNAQIGAAFHPPLQAVEVALRNSINHALVAEFGSEWWKAQKFEKVADRERNQDIEVVCRRITQRQLPLVTGQVVAGLSFGFWVGMLQPKYNPPIWGAHLRTSFPSLPSGTTRNQIFQLSRNVSALRNRISHHEPIFKRDLSLDFKKVMQLLGWLCPETEQWLRPYCDVPELIRKKP